MSKETLIQPTEIKGKVPETILLPKVDLFIRDSFDDPANDFFKDYGTKPFWDSPDLWVRNQDDGELHQEHQNPVAGKINWFYARVTNRGLQTAHFFLTTFVVKVSYNTRFFYPNDYLDKAQTVGWYSAEGLKKGQSAVVKKPMYVADTKGADACWLAAVLTEGDMPPVGTQAYESNNLAQKNLCIVNLTRGESKQIQFMMGSLYQLDPELVRVELLRPKEWAHVPVTLTYPNAHEVEGMFKTTGAASFLRREGEITLDKKGAFHLDFHPGPLVGFPVALPAAKLIPFGLNVTVPKEAKPNQVFDIHLVQRDDKQKVVGGFTVRVNVVAGH